MLENAADFTRFIPKVQKKQVKNRISPVLIDAVVFLHGQIGRNFMHSP